MVTWFLHRPVDDDSSWTVIPLTDEDLSDLDFRRTCDKGRLTYDFGSNATDVCELNL